MTKNGFVRGEKLYEGKANTLYATNGPTFIEMEATDRISAGNGEKKDIVSGKGVVNNTISTMLFKLFEQHGVPTHFVCEGTTKSSKIVRKACMIKLEVIGRFIAAGSCCKHYGIEEGTTFDTMTYELTYKDDSLGDPFISESMAAYGLKVATPAVLDVIKKYTYVIGDVAKRFFSEIGITLVDFKVEFGYDAENGMLILCDEFSPDTCRLWDKDGNSLDKDVFRKDLGHVQEAYKKILDLVEGGK